MKLIHTRLNRKKKNAFVVTITIIFSYRFILLQNGLLFTTHSMKLHQGTLLSFTHVATFNYMFHPALCTAKRRIFFYPEYKIAISTVIILSI